MTTIPDPEKWHIEYDANNKPFAVRDVELSGASGAAEPPWPYRAQFVDKGNDPEYERARIAGLARG